MHSSLICFFLHTQYIHRHYIYTCMYIYMCYVCVCCQYGKFILRQCLAFSMCMCNADTSLYKCGTYKMCWLLHVLLLTTAAAV